MSKEGIKLHKCEPNYNIWFHDGESFELSSDLARMKREVEKWEGKPGFDRYLSFLKESHRHYEASAVHVLHRDFNTYLSMLRPAFLRHLLALHPFESIYSRAKRYFWTERLRRVFTFGSMYMGMSPYEAPGTYSLLQYTELAEGIWYPEGGFNKIPSTIADISRRQGVQYRMNTTVQSVTTDSSNSHATGVILNDGTTIHADTVICNADLVYAYNNLLPPTSYAKSLSSRPASCSSISFYWALDSKIPQLKAHNIFLAEEYKASFDQIFHDQSLPEEPSFYVNVPSRVDPTAAPEGKDAVVVLCPVGHLLSAETSTPASVVTEGKKRGLAPQSEEEWQALVGRARSSVLSTVETRLGIDLRSHIIHEELNTPASWEERFNLDKGAILGLSHSFFNVLCFRPSTRHPNLKNLYFCGASTHPGTGVPIVLAGSKIVADQVLEDRKLPKPWGEWDAQRYIQYGETGSPNAPGAKASANGSTKPLGGDMSYTADMFRSFERKEAPSKLDRVQDPGVGWLHAIFAVLATVLVVMWKRGRLDGYVPQQLAV